MDAPFLLLLSSSSSSSLFFFYKKHQRPSFVYLLSPTPSILFHTQVCLLLFSLLSFFFFLIINILYEFFFSLLNFTHNKIKVRFFFSSHLYLVLFILFYFYVLNNCMNVIVGIVFLILLFNFN
jgi:hypothetical protein